MDTSSPAPSAAELAVELAAPEVRLLAALHDRALAQAPLLRAMRASRGLERDAVAAGLDLEELAGILLDRLHPDLTSTPATAEIQCALTAAHALAAHLVSHRSPSRAELLAPSLDQLQALRTECGVLSSELTELLCVLLLESTASLPDLLEAARCALADTPVPGALRSLR